MLQVVDNLGNLKCAKCGKILKKSELKESLFLPRTYKLQVNKVGVCEACFKDKRKQGVVMPSYYKHLSSDQRINLERQMKSVRSLLLRDIEDEELRRKIEKL